MKTIRFLLCLCLISFNILLFNFSYLIGNSSQMIINARFLIPQMETCEMVHPPGHGGVSKSLLRFCKNQMLWLVSAYLDPRSRNLVRVIAAGNRSLISSKPRCNFFYDGTSAPTNKSVKHFVFTTTPLVTNINLDGILFRCYYHGAVPQSVNISFDEQPTRDSVTLRVKATPGAVQRNRLAACVAPLHGTSDSTAPRLSEWLELNQLLGIEHFVIYNFSVNDPWTERVLRHYMRRGVVEIVPWNPPLPIDREGPWPPSQALLHYFGQVVAENDCMYRLLHHYRWIQFIDLDEFIVPRRKQTTLDVLKDASVNTICAAYIFLQAFYNLAFENYSASLNEVEKPLMMTQLYTKREPDILLRDENHKVVIEPGRGGESKYVHDMFDFDPPDRKLTSVECLVDPRAATLNHYRHFPLSTRKTFMKGRPPIRDEAMKRFRKRLLQRLQGLYKALD